MFIETKIYASIHSFVKQYNNFKALLEDIDEQFETSDKALTNTLFMKISSMKITYVRDVHEYIMKNQDLAIELRTLEVQISKTFIVLYILNFLPI